MNGLDLIEIYGIDAMEVLYDLYFSVFSEEQKEMFNEYIKEKYERKDK